MEGRAKARGKAVRVQKNHADEKADESSMDKQLIGVVMHCNRFFGGTR
jgi:hypothetical protein